MHPGRPKNHAKPTHIAWVKDGVEELYPLKKDGKLMRQNGAIVSSIAQAAPVLRSSVSELAISVKDDSEPRPPSGPEVEFQFPDLWDLWACGGGENDSFTF
jgi:hypothetical protein